MALKVIDVDGEDAREEEEVSTSNELTKDMDWERFTLIETIYFETNPGAAAGGEEKAAHRIEHWDPAEQAEIIFDEGFLFDDEDPDKTFEEMRRKTIHRRKFEQEEERLSESIVRDSLEKKSPERAESPRGAQWRGSAREARNAARLDNIAPAPPPAEVSGRADPRSLRLSWASRGDAVTTRPI